MKKLLLPILAITLFGCSKSGPSPSTPTTSKTIHSIKMTHQGRTIFVTDSTRASITGIPDRPLIIKGFFNSLPNAKCAITVDMPEIIFDAVGDRFGATSYLGDYIVEGVPHDAFYFHYEYWYSGIKYSGSIGQTEDSLSRIKVSSFSDSTIIGTAHLFLKDSSFMDLEFNLKNSL